MDDNDLKTINRYLNRPQEDTSGQIVDQVRRSGKSGFFRVSLGMYGWIAMRAVLAKTGPELTTTGQPTLY